MKGNDGRAKGELIGRDTAANFHLYSHWQVGVKHIKNNNTNITKRWTSKQHRDHRK